METARRLLEEAIREGLRRVEAWKASGRSIRRYAAYPHLDYMQTGLPWMSETFDPPPDYKDALSSRHLALRELFGVKPTELDTPPEAFPSWRAFLEHAEADDQLRRYFGFDQVDPQATEGPRAQQFALFGALYLLSSAVDRMIHLSRGTAFSSETFDTLFTEWSTAVTEKDLPIEMLAPLGFVRFETDSFPITEDLSIERMTDEVQRSRYRHDLRPFAMAATHAIVLRNQRYPRDTSRSSRRYLLPRPELFKKAINDIDLLCAALCAAQGEPLGYGQVLITHVGWADHWDADLLPSEQFEAHAFPRQFERYGILAEPVLVPVSACRSAAAIYDGFTKYKSMSFAARRLHRASLRDRDDDAVVDLAVGLEALLASEDSLEIAYRVRMRFGTLARLASTMPPAEASQRAKELYKTRSDIVHGKKEIDEGRLGQARENGMELLRTALRGFADRPDLLDEKRLDSAMLTGEGV